MILINEYTIQHNKTRHVILKSGGYRTKLEDVIRSQDC